MHTPPTEPYSGLTLILDHPSRFDTSALLSGIAGKYVEEECIAPLRLSACDIRTKDEPAPLLPNTRYVALLGIKNPAAPEGYTTAYRGVRAIHTFFPQDACDYRNIESNDEDDDDSISDADTKDSYPTRRANYRFWLRQHFHKLLNPGQLFRPDIVVYPPEKTVLEFLRSTRDDDLYLDIETSRLHRCITCIGLSSSTIWPKTYVIPVYLHKGNRAYVNWHLIYKELVAAFLANTLVIHNAAFDLFILRAWYKLPFPHSLYCTMCSNHRIHIEAEKSLSHAIALWTEQGYHKDVNTEVFNAEQERKMWNYNGLDVFNLKLIKDTQLAYAKNIPGLIPSIDQANTSIIPYLDTASLRGLRLNSARAVETEINLSIQKTQLNRVASMLVGKTFNPGSTKQCADFFHKTLNYKPAGRGESGAPAMGRKQLYQLMLKYNNPLIPVILQYRKTAKDLSMLTTEKWRMP